MKDKEQNQNSGDSSTNLQGENITIINQGISYIDAKEIALDVFKSNFLQLSQTAAQTARERAEEITNHFLEEVQPRHPDKLGLMNNPAMLSALYSAQKEYAKSGDSEIEEILVDLLVDRLVEEKRSIRQLVLNESLDIVTKLTDKQLDALTVAFIITRTRNLTIKNLHNLKKYLEQYIYPFVSNISIERSCYEHLVYTGCASLTIIRKQIENIFRDTYKGMFCKGFTKEEFDIKMGDSKLYNQLIIPCFHDQSKYQLGYNDEEALQKVCDSNKYSSEVVDKLKTFLNNFLMNQAEVKSYLESLDPMMIKLFDVWSKSSLSLLELTSVGIAIAQANFRRKTKIHFDLSIWIKE
jgi:hypothetical protein